MTQRFSHLDAAESAFFARELEYVYAKTYDIKYPQLKARQFVPVSNEANPGARSVTYEQYDRVGRAKITAPGAVDAPRVDVFGKEFNRPVRLVTDSYGYHILEIREAAMAGKPLQTRKANAARRAIEEILDEVAALGSPEHGIATGFLNNADVSLETKTGAVWASASADTIIADVAKMYSKIDTVSKGVETANTLILPDAAWTVIATKPRATTSDTTVLEFLLRSFPMLTAVEKWYRCNDAGAASKTRAVLYNRSPEYLSQEIPSEFEQLPVFQRGQNFEIECMATTAGTAFYYPLSACYMDDI